MLIKKVRYAVVGLGHIAQVAVLPAFHHARTNTQLSALVSGSRIKLSKLSATYGSNTSMITIDMTNACEVAS